MGARPPGQGTDSVVSDDAFDALHRTFRRLRRSMIKPPLAKLPMPSLGRHVDFAAVMACDTLAELTAPGTQVSVKDLAAALLLEHSTVSRLVSDMEVDGLLVRTPDPADRRRTQVALTQDGYLVVADSRRIQRFVARTVMTDWSADDVEELTRLLNRLADATCDPQMHLDQLIRKQFYDAVDSSSDVESSSDNGVSHQHGQHR